MGGWKRNLSCKDYHMIIARTDYEHLSTGSSPVLDKVVAALAFCIRTINAALRNVLYISAVGVDWDWQHQGHGGNLMRCIRLKAAKFGIRQIALDASDESVGWWRKQGF